MLGANDLQDMLDKETCMIEQDSIDSDSESEDHSHTLRSQLTAQTNDFILTHWSFESTEARTSYLSKDLTGLACLCFPFALDDRIHLIARLFSLMFLLGEMISGLDIDDALDCLQSLQEATKGYWEADRTHAEVWMLCDLLEEIRSHEYALADDIMDAMWTFLSLRMGRRGRRTKRDDTTSGFQNSFVDAGMLLPLHRFATGVMVDEEEFEYSKSEVEQDDFGFCAAELQANVNAS
ncbi:Putative isoprenoid synthase domain superfamily [Septoria linicola]|uniref:Isoprenoid synthase domain superfamily n=1 Tax=Septoria linicola TaxID=215465 RepID=A0A9Q9AL99_9PEZI|nr:Putative isoprenoid synthase domain superfamily [Septoria linicola]